MADIFVDDGGSNTAPHETWAKAATTFATGVSAASAGDRIIIGHNHSEDPGGNIVYTLPGTNASPNVIISATSTAGGSTVTYNKADNIQIDNSTTAVDLTINGTGTFWGVSFKTGDDLTFAGTAGNAIEFHDSVLELSGTIEAKLLGGQRDGRTKLTLIDTDINFSGGGVGCNIAPNSLQFIWKGGTLLHTGTQPTSLFDVNLRWMQYHISGVDFSAITNSLVDAGSAEMRMEMHHCLLNSSSGFLTVVPAHHASTCLMVGCDDSTGNDLYRLEYFDFWGSTVHDDVIFLDSATLRSSDGTTPISWKMVSTAGAAEFTYPTKSPPIYAWVDSTGSKTFTVEIVWDSATNAQDDEIWLELEFLEASADTDSAFTDDRMADITATPADQADSSETWTGTGGFTNENTQKLVATATVNRVGPVIGRVCVGKPSSTFYANAKMNVAAA